MKIKAWALLRGMPHSGGGFWSKTPAGTIAYPGQFKTLVSAADDIYPVSYLSG